MHKTILLLVTVQPREQIDKRPREVTAGVGALSDGQKHMVAGLNAGARIFQHRRISANKVPETNTYDDSVKKIWGGKAKAGEEPLCILQQRCQNRRAFSGILSGSSEPANYLTDSLRRNYLRR